MNISPISSSSQSQPQQSQVEQAPLTEEARPTMPQQQQPVVRPKTKRSVDIVPTTSAQAPEAPDVVTTAQKMFNTFTITEITQDQLDTINIQKEDFIKQYGMSPRTNTDKQKLAALILHDINTRRMLGKASKKEIDEANRAINGLFNQIDPNQLSDGSLGTRRNIMANPAALWDVEAEAISLARVTTKKGKAYQQALQKQQERHIEKLEVISALSEWLEQTIKQEEKTKEQTPIATTCLTTADSPDEFTFKNLAAHQIYREYDDEVNLKNIEYLSIYIHKLEKFLTEEHLSSTEVQHLAFTLMQSLALFLAQCQQRCTLTKLAISQATSDAGRPAAAQEYSRKCIDLTKWIVRTNLYLLADHHILSTICHNLSLIALKEKKLLVTLAKRANFKAVTHEEKQIIHTNDILYCEMLEDYDLFQRAMNDASHYSLLPLFIMIFSDIGSTEKDLEWKERGGLNPDKAIAYLIKLGASQQALIDMQPTIKRARNWVEFNAGKRSSTTVREWAMRVALYDYLLGEVKRGNTLLASSGLKEKTRLLHALSLISKKDYESASTFIQSATDLVRRHQPLLGILKEKEAEKKAETSERKALLREAMGHLENPVQYRPELLKHLARIQEKLDLQHDAYQSLKKLEMHLSETMNLADSEQQLLSIRTKLDIMKESPALRRIIEEASQPVKAKQKKSKARTSGKQASKQKPQKKHSAKTSQPYTPESLLPTKDEPKRDELALEPASSASSSVVAAHRQQDLPEDSAKPVFPASLRKQEIDDLMESTKPDRYPLYDSLLNPATIDYDEILKKHDQLLQEHNNPVIQMMFIQNKAWTLRTYSYDPYALAYNAAKQRKSITRLKIAIRLEAMDLLLNKIEDVGQLLTLPFPENWKGNPLQMVEDPRFTRALTGLPRRFLVQYAAQFGTWAHFKDDIHSDQPIEENEKQHAIERYGMTFETSYELSKALYRCRTMIKALKSEEDLRFLHEGS